MSVKSNALEVLDRQLYNRAKKKEYGYVVLSSATDPYLGIEEKLEMTREALKLLAFYRFPVHVITKSNLINRDFDVLHEIAERAYVPPEYPNLNGVIISYSFSTLNEVVGKRFEPGAPSPSIRLESHRLALAEGFHSGISMMPLLPYFTDTTESLVQLFSTFSEVGSKYVLPASITLYGRSKVDSYTLTMRMIQAHYPELEGKYEKFFADSTEMPGFYLKAFSKKMDELSQDHGVPLSIVG